MNVKTLDVFVPGSSVIRLTQMSDDCCEKRVETRKGLGVETKKGLGVETRKGLGVETKRGLGVETKKGLGVETKKA